MASSDQHRVKKDTSARKNDIEAAAKHAAREAYIKATIASYDEDIQSMEAEHTKTITEMRTEHEKAICEIQEQQKSVEAQHLKALMDLQNEHENAIRALKEHQKSLVNNAVTTTRDKAQVEISSLKSRILSLERDTEKLQQREREHLKKINEQDTNHRKEIDTLKSKIYFQIHCKSKNRKTRTYFGRPGQSLASVAADLWVDIKKPPQLLRHNQVLISNERERLSLEKLGIKDGDELWYS